MAYYFYNTWIIYLIVIVVIIIVKSIIFLCVRKHLRNRAEQRRAAQIAAGTGPNAVFTTGQMQPGSCPPPPGYPGYQPSYPGHPGFQESEAQKPPSYDAIMGPNYATQYSPQPATAPREQQQSTNSQVQTC